MSFLDGLFDDVPYDSDETVAAEEETCTVGPEEETCTVGPEGETGRAEGDSAETEEYVETYIQSLSPIINTPALPRPVSVNTPMPESPSGSHPSHSPQHAAANSEKQLYVQIATMCQQCGQPISIQPTQAAALKRAHIRNIKDLHDLLCEGAINQSEYEQQKYIILRQMLRL